MRHGLGSCKQICSPRMCTEHPQLQAEPRRQRDFLAGWGTCSWGCGQHSHAQTCTPPFSPLFAPNKQEKSGFKFLERCSYFLCTEASHLHTHTQINCIHSMRLKSRTCKRNILQYNAVLLRVEDGSELKTWQLNSSAMSSKLQSVLFLPFMESGGKAMTSTTPQWWRNRSLCDFPAEALPDEPQKPTPGFLPFHSFLLSAPHWHLQN